MLLRFKDGMSSVGDKCISDKYLYILNTYVPEYEIKWNEKIEVKITQIIIICINGRKRKSSEKSSKKHTDSLLSSPSVVFVPKSSLLIAPHSGAPIGFSA